MNQPQTDKRRKRNNVEQKIDTITEEHAANDGKVPQGLVDLPVYDVAKQMPLDALVLVVGKRRFGKTIFIRDMLSKMWRYFPRGGYVFTATKHNGFWQQHFPDSRIYGGTNIDWEVVEQIQDEQKRKREERAQTGEAKLNYVPIVFDDVISSRHDMRYVERFLQLVFNGRHYDLLIMIAAQDIKGVPPDVRQNADLVALTYQVQARQMETIQKDFADFPELKKSFPTFLQSHTHDFQMLLIDQATAKTNAEEVFFTAKADPEPKPFKIGDYMFWKEAGCDWKRQLRIYGNLQQSDLSKDENKGKLEQLVRKAWLENKEMERRFAEFDRDGDKESELYFKWKTGAATAAPVQEMQERAKQFGELPDNQKRVRDEFSYLEKLYQRPEPQKIYEYNRPRGFGQ